jgi:hypothetical protein
MKTCGIKVGPDVENITDYRHGEDRENKKKNTSHVITDES